MSAMYAWNLDVDPTCLVLARIPFRYPQSFGIQLIALTFFGGLGVLLLLRLIMRHLSSRIPGDGHRLLPCYERLGHFGPDAPCPCGSQVDGAAKRYSDCCRGKDVTTLEQEIREHLMQRWMHRSYAGRRWSRPMAQRLEDYPIPETVILPRWVRKPEEFEFPITEKLLRKWRPQQQNAPRDKGDEVADDLPL